jgi:hypothetical protein
MDVWVLLIDMVRGTRNFTAYTFSSAEKAKEAAHLQFQCDALETTIEWEPLIMEVYGCGTEVVGYITFGEFKESVSIKRTQLNETY